MSNDVYYMPELGRQQCLAKEDVPESVMPSATALQCADHPDAPWDPGFGYAGGGFGDYRICRECRRVFGKKGA